MEWVYVLLAIAALIAAGCCIGKAGLNIGVDGPGSKSSYLMLGLAVVFVALSFAAMLGMLSEQGRKKESQKREVQAMGFSAVSVEYTNNAGVKLRSQCLSREIHLYKRDELWYVGTEGVNSSKPVVNESEVARRPEVKWWCSKPPIKN